MDERNIKIKKRSNKINKNYYGYIFTAPFIVGFLLFSFYPLVYTFYLSLTNMTMMSKKYSFVGFETSLSYLMISFLCKLWEIRGKYGY